MGVLERFLEKIRKGASAYGFTCDGCGEEIFAYPQIRLCENCNRKIVKNEKITCDKCGRSAKTKGVCLDCKSHLPKFSSGLSSFVYQGYICSLLNRMKNGDRYLSYFFGEELAKSYLRRFSDKEDVLVLCVPLTKEKQRIRGYNQAEEIVKALLPCLEHAGIRAEYDSEILQKRREAPSQKTLTKAERIKNVEGLFHVHKRTACKDKIILLIDDIMTTGATGSECAKLLLSAGAKEVRFLTCASLEEHS